MDYISRGWNNDESYTTKCNSPKSFQPVDHANIITKKRNGREIAHKSRSD